MFSSPANHSSHVLYPDKVLKSVVSLFVLSLSFVVIYQKILVEFLGPVFGSVKPEIYGIY